MFSVAGNTASADGSGYGFAAADPFSDDDSEPPVEAGPDGGEEGAADISEAALRDKAFKLRAGLPATDRRYRLKLYKDVFVGSEAVKWLLRNGIASSAPAAVALGQQMLDAGFFAHVVDEHGFENAYLFYRWAAAGLRRWSGTRRGCHGAAELASLTDRVSDAPVPIIESEYEVPMTSNPDHHSGSEAEEGDGYGLLCLRSPQLLLSSLRPAPIECEARCMD